jgi:hypothetical protein
MRKLDKVARQQDDLSRLLQAQRKRKHQDITVVVDPIGVVAEDATQDEEEPGTASNSNPNTHLVSAGFIVRYGGFDSGCRHYSGSFDSQPNCSPLLPGPLW